MATAEPILELGAHVAAANAAGAHAFASLRRSIPNDVGSVTSATAVAAGRRGR